MKIKNIPAEEIAERYKSGETSNKIADDIGVSRQRVHQVLKSLGITKNDGGQQVSAKKRRRKKLEKTNEYKIRHFGCTLDQWQYFRDMAEHRKDTPLAAYTIQKRNAKRRGICWDMTIVEWWYVWQESGKWEERGQGKYVMARDNDEGGYTVDNVRIVTASQNACEYYEVNYDDWLEKFKNRNKKTPRLSGAKTGGVL